MFNGRPRSLQPCGRDNHRTLASGYGFLKNAMESDKIRSPVIIVTNEVTRTARRHAPLHRKYLRRQRVLMPQTTNSVSR
jgi:hypothetical protein